MRSLALLFTIIFAFAASATEPTDNLYFYKAKLLSVYDGDTLRVDIDLGLGVWIHNEPIRLDGLDAPEVRGANKIAGIASRDYLLNLIGSRPIILETVKDDREKYGRIIANLWVLGNGGWCPVNTWCLVNSQMIKAGHAVEKVY